MRPAIAALLLLPALAAAQERPAPLPLRDVDVTYRIEGGAQRLEQRSRFAASLQRMRVDTPTPGVYSIMDYRAHTLSFVVEGDRASLDTTMPPPQPGAYTRLGEDRVAGLPCTEWQTVDSRRQPVVTCFTADGVMLRVRSGAQPMATAVRVAYAPQEPGLFAVPAGFDRVTRKAAP